MIIKSVTQLLKSKLMVKAVAVLGYSICSRLQQAINIFEICGGFLPIIKLNVFRVMLVKKNLSNYNQSLRQIKYIRSKIVLFIMNDRKYILHK